MAKEFSFPSSARTSMANSSRCSLAKQSLKSSVIVNSKIIARILFSQIALRHICDVKNSRLWHDLPVSVNDRLILPFHKDFIFMKLPICEGTKIKPSQKIPNLQ